MRSKMMGSVVSGLALMVAAVIVAPVVSADPVQEPYISVVPGHFVAAKMPPEFTKVQPDVYVLSRWTADPATRHLVDVPDTHDYNDGKAGDLFAPLPKCDEPLLYVVSRKTPGAVGYAAYDQQLVSAC